VQFRMAPGTETLNLPFELHDLELPMTASP
jgi:hypothetical protein